MRIVKRGKGREEREVGDDGDGDGELLSHDWDNEVVNDSTVVVECSKWDGAVSSFTTYLGTYVVASISTREVERGRGR